MKYNKILIIDDDFISIELLSSIIKRLGYDFITSRNAMDAINIVNESNNIDCILVDLKMPTVSGVKFIKKIRMLNNIINIIVITSYDSEEIKNLCIECGANNFLLKPININVIKKILESGNN